MTFTGDTVTPCSEGRGDPATVSLEDGNIAASFWQSHGVRVEWIAPPGNVGTVGPNTIAAAYESVAAAHGEGYADGGVNLYDPTNPADSWPWQLPCASYDVSAGACGPGDLVQVRTSTTNGHMCDVDSGLDPCPVYSSGIIRYGSVVASAAISAESAS